MERLEAEIIEAEGVKKINKFKQSDYNKNFSSGTNLKATL
jgi:hypothetical protein